MVEGSEKAEHHLAPEDWREAGIERRQREERVTADVHCLSSRHEAWWGPWSSQIEVCDEVD